MPRSALRLRWLVAECFRTGEANQAVLASSGARLFHMACGSVPMDLLRSGAAQGHPRPVHRRRNTLPPSRTHDLRVGAEAPRPARRPERSHWIFGFLALACLVGLSL